MDYQLWKAREGCYSFALGTRFMVMVTLGLWEAYTAPERRALAAMEKFPQCLKFAMLRVPWNATQAHKNQTPLYFHPSLFLLYNKYLSTHLVQPHCR